MELEILGRQNPWWVKKEALLGDFYIREFEEASLKWYPAYIGSVNTEEDAVHVVFGPRQVGKTTSFRLMMRALIESRGIAPRRVLYFNCEEAAPSTSQRLADIIRAYISWIRADSDERVHIFLDEATSIRDWEKGIKILAEEGKLRGVTLFATGSHMMGMRRGAERLPGRRGSGLDIPLFPLTFREYLLAVREDLKSALPPFQGWNKKILKASLEEVSLSSELIAPLLDSYLKTGGFPRSINQFHAFTHLRPDIYKIYRDAFLGDMQRIGRKESIFREIMQWLLVRRENPFEWTDIARETYAGTHPTVREYLEDAESCFIIDIFYRIGGGGKPFRTPRSPKKVYFRDPFIFHSLRAWALGYPDPCAACEEFFKDSSYYGYMVESLVASHLRRKCGENIFFFREEKEIDFAIFEGQKNAALLEVKYQARVNPENAKMLKKHGGGIMLTRNTFASHENVLLAPAAYFLALL
ncbi:MAG: ATP-binding protein [Candidatus Eremiobacteraeota bacterium]|nr:ATP-binding protein [Candidatus Eremiobacteraeota bacterium]